MPTVIHPSAIVEPGAVIGADCDIRAGAIITRHAILGDRVTVHPYAVIGGDPQDLRFDAKTPSFARIGSGTTLREYSTINRSTQPGGATQVGENCYLMTGSHLAHDCVVGHHVVMANNVLLAGHVHIGDHTFIGGGAAVHQFGHIGESVMIAGLARVNEDVPPYVLMAERSEVSGLNLVGLKRRGFSREQIKELKFAYRHVYFTQGNLRALAAARLQSGEEKSTEAQAFLKFFSLGQRRIARPRRVATAEKEAENV